MNSNEQAPGQSDQAARHGDQIDPDQGRSAHAGDDSEREAQPESDPDRSDDSEREAQPESDPDSPGATIDDPEPAEPNEPG